MGLLILKAMEIVAILPPMLHQKSSWPKGFGAGPVDDNSKRMVECPGREE